MSQSGTAFHYVCTHEEARRLAFSHLRFWVSNCGCRERKGKCERSRLDVCLIFRNDKAASGSGMKEIPLTDVVTLFDEASEKKLVTRPYRNDKDRSITDGICFCCDDCCEYFTNPQVEPCDKGELRQFTQMEKCTFCGDCVPVCYFRARSMVDDELQLDAANCYGCGLCADACPEKCIQLVPR